MGLTYRVSCAEPTTEDIKKLGVGMWCFELKHHSGTAEEMASKAQEIGLRSVRLKVHNGVEEFRDAPTAAEVALAMHSRGILALYWGFNYANHPEQEAELIISFLERDECDGYVFNTEKPLEKTGKWDAEELLVQIVRKHRDSCPLCKRKFLGFCTYAIPSLHSSLNYKTFVENTDFIEPQVYHGDMKKDPREALVWTMHAWQKWQNDNGISKPIIPLGQAFDPHVDRVNNRLRKGEIKDFGDAAKGYYGLSFWCWQRATPEYWDEIQKICADRNKFITPDYHPDTILGKNSAQQPAVEQENIWWVRLYFPILAGLLVCLAVVHAVFDMKQKVRRRIGLYGLISALLWPLLSLALVISVAGLVLYLAWSWALDTYNAWKKSSGKK
jgi:hypothetical protein